ncbi:hypothetical protein [Paraliobacillus ryukyuensis]|uniref:hypothetical protein n=1 Tax=Paraliobacillus ryukyuensis TaxID=200904 RepID=UPI0009A6580C|nr:hypothetical protein [Paraliobacillus ryukyuensis]
MQNLLIALVVGFIIAIVMIGNKKRSKNEAEEKYTKHKRVLLWLLGINYIGFLSFQLVGLQPVMGMPFHLAEMMSGFGNIVIFVAIPIAIFIYLDLLYTYSTKRGLQKPTASTVRKATFIVITTVAFVFIINSQSQDVFTYGVFEVQQKNHEDGKYYLELEKRKIRVSSNEYHLIEENEQYAIGFRWHKNNPNIGYLRTIDPN